MLVQGKFLIGYWMKGLYLWFLFVGPLISLSSSNWAIIWVGFELNMICFLGLLCEVGKGVEADFLVNGLLGMGTGFSCCPETLSKYFLAQSIGTFLFLVFPMFNGLGVFNLAVIVFLCGMFLKGGVAPLHQWFPSVCGGLSWGANSLLFTWQKVGPTFFIVKALCQCGGVVVWVGVANLVFGVFGAFGQSQFRQLLGYSSIAHMGWLLTISHFSEVSFFYYFWCYVLVILPLILFLGWANIFSFNGLLSFSEVGGKWGLLVCVLLLSVGGLPPFLGFFMKVYGLFSMTQGGYFFLGAVYCIFASLSFGYYLNLVFYFVLASFSNGTGLGGFKWGWGGSGLVFPPMVGWWVFFLCLISIMGFPLISGMVV